MGPDQVANAATMVNIMQETAGNHAVCLVSPSAWPKAAFRCLMAQGPSSEVSLSRLPHPTGTRTSREPNERRKPSLCTDLAPEEAKEAQPVHGPHLYRKRREPFPLLLQWGRSDKGFATAKEMEGLLLVMTRLSLRSVVSLVLSFISLRFVLSCP